MYANEVQAYILAVDIYKTEAPFSPNNIVQITEVTFGKRGGGDQVLLYSTYMFQDGQDVQVCPVPRVL